MYIIMICYKPKVKCPVHAVELGAVHAINVVFQVIRQYEVRYCSYSQIA